MAGHDTILSDFLSDSSNTSFSIDDTVTIYPSLGDALASLVWKLVSRSLVVAAFYILCSFFL